MKHETKGKPEFKPVIGWAVIQDGVICRYADSEQFDLYSDRRVASNSMRDCIYPRGHKPRIVAVEIRELRQLPPKKRRKG